jgi:hypothetical protein
MAINFKLILGIIGIISLRYHAPRQFLDSRLQLSNLKDIIIEESPVQQQLMITFPTTPV